jgi:hypothetical protein
VIGLALAALAAQAAITPSRAEDNSSAGVNIGMTGVAVPVCLLGAPTPAGGSNATYAANAITLTEFIDPSTALVKQSSMTLQISNAMCNYNAYLSVTSQNGGLTSADASGVVGDAGSFMTVVPYTLQASWGNVNVTLNTKDGNKKAQVQAGGANSAAMSLNFATQNSTLPVVQGHYTDTVTVKVGAAM